MSRRKLTVTLTPGFVLLMLLFGRSCGWDVLTKILLAAAAHELGHILVLLALDVPPRSLRLGALGAVLTADRSRLSYGEELLVLAGGPLANFLFASLLSRPGSGAKLLIGVNLTLGMFNLLPIRPLDGGRILYDLIAWAADPELAERGARWVGGTLALLASGFLAWLMLSSGGSLWLMPPAFGFFAVSWREWIQKQ